jgi:hypothetical protein
MVDLGAIAHNDGVRLGQQALQTLRLVHEAGVIGDHQLGGQGRNRRCVHKFGNYD